MNIPLEINYRGLEKNESIENLINRKTRKLEKICSYISSCHIALEASHKQGSKESRYRVRLDITIPAGHEIVVKKEPANTGDYAPLDAVIREAFESATRQVKELVERQEGEIKTHPEQETEAVVSEIYKDEGYGMLKSIEGREIYFHRHSVAGDEFEKLEIGTGVQFVMELGDKGPQASTVRIVSKPGARIKQVVKGS